MAEVIGLVEVISAIADKINVWMVNAEEESYSATEAAEITMAMRPWLRKMFFEES
jgi:hypothetical protein